MTKKSVRALLALLAAAVTLAIAIPMAVGARQSGAQEDLLAGKVFGTPPAVITEDDYSGPPVVGDTVSYLPNVVPLQPGNRTHHVRIDIIAQEIEIAPGVRYQAWTFGGTVPGPVLHVREGDRVVFTMRNRTMDEVSVTSPVAGNTPFIAQAAAANLQKSKPVQAPMHHSIDFHAATVAADDKWRAVMPGQTITFEWVANYPGIFMYHCGVPPVLQHVAMGQYGIVIVSPREGYPTDAAVNREYAVVQSEFYLKEGPDGPDGLYVLDFDAAQKKQPSHVLFNGHAGALNDTPLQAREGDRVRLYFHNVGPNDQSSAHVIGAIFDRVWYEGNLKNEWRGMQTVLVGSSNGAVMEFIVPEEGRYVLVDHEFADVQKGAVGQIVATSKTGTSTRSPGGPMKH